MVLTIKNQLNSSFVLSRYNSLRESLSKHPLYAAIHNENNLKVFMEHHVYAVWDFMSLIKSLQKHFAPSKFPWIPPKNSRYANFINKLVLEEESDDALIDSVDATYASHFESYCQAMLEAGANIHPILKFIEVVGNDGLDTALEVADVPTPAKQFMMFTFDIIGRNQPHLLAAALAYGREALVPQLYRSILGGLQISPSDAPNLYAYLNRHIQLDEQEHGPLATQMVQELCDGADEKLNEAMEVAEQAVATRLEFWNGIHDALRPNVCFAI